MAARLAFSRSALAGSFIIGTGSSAFAGSVLYAEAPPSSPAHSRKPIYDLPPPATPIPAPSSTSSDPSTSNSSSFLSSILPSSEPTPKPTSPSPTDRLASQIKVARHFTAAHIGLLEDKINALFSSSLRLENNLTTTIANLAPPIESGETLLPGSIYVLVSGMAGSIVARNRNILLRASLPLALGLGTAYTVLPNTMRNVGDLVWTWEERVPVVRDAHLRVAKAVREWENRAERGVEQVTKTGGEGLRKSRETVEGWVQGR